MTTDRPSGRWLSRIPPSKPHSRLWLVVLLTNLVVVASAASVVFAESVHAHSLRGASLLVAGGIAILFGLVVGLALTTVFRRPLEALVHHVQRDDQAALATRSLRLAVNGSAEARILVQNGMVVLANPAAATLFGVATEHLLGRVDEVFEDVALSTDRGDAVTIDEAAGAAVSHSVRLRITRPNRSERWAQVHAVEHDDDSATVLIIGRDITEERRVEALRTEIVSLVSHDLRAPLAVISGYLDLLGRPLEDEERMKAVSAASRSAEHMNELLEDLLSATCAEELLVPSRLTPVSMASLAEEVVFAFEHTSSHRIRAHADCEGTVLGDDKRLHQVLVNLVTNAIKHAPDNSRIDVKVLCRGERVVTLVEDEGPGIPEDDREHVFERFARLEHGGLERPGTGLGLFIVRAIVEGHGGSVHAEDSDAAPGVRFVIDLPAAGPS